jgi:hypothetical protein
VRGLQIAIDAATSAGRDPRAFTPALYVTVNVGEPDDAHAELERFVLDYYGIPLDAMASLQAFYSGPVDGAIEWLRGFVDAGARHVVVRFGSFEPRRQLERAQRVLAEVRSSS